MKKKDKTQLKRIRDFFRDYVDISYKNERNVIRLSRANSPEHNLRICEICVELLENKVPFYTEVRLKCGTRPDIVCPTHIKPLIEVMHTEDISLFDVKKKDKYPEELQDEIIFNKTDKRFKWIDVN